MGITTIKLLQPHELRILRQIIIFSDRKNGEVELGSILYTRPLTPDYNFVKQQEEDEKAADNFHKYLQEYPKQKNYPIDEVDNMILDAIRQNYPKAAMKNDTIFFNVDLEKLAVLKNRNVMKTAIYVSPEFSNVYNLHDYMDKEFRQLRIDVNIYCYYKPEFMDGQPFFANYNVRNEFILDRLGDVKFE